MILGIRHYRWLETAILVVLVFLILYLWDSWAVYPLKMLVVFFHELSHAAMAVATGGELLEINLSPEQGGMTKTSGGIPELILTAGYLGSLICGGALMVLASRTGASRLLMMFLGAMILITGSVFVRPVMGFGFLYCMAAGFGCLLAAMYWNAWANGMLLKVIGLTSCLYVIPDIQRDGAALGTGFPSDAEQLAALTNIPRLVWVSIWVVLALVLTALFLLMATRRQLLPKRKAKATKSVDTETTPTVEKKRRLSFRKREDVPADSPPEDPATSP